MHHLEANLEIWKAAEPFIPPEQPFVDGGKADWDWRRCSALEADLKRIAAGYAGGQQENQRVVRRVEIIISDPVLVEHALRFCC